MRVSLAAKPPNLRSLPIGPWAGLGVLAAWAAIALLTGGLLHPAAPGRPVGILNWTCTTATRSERTRQ